MRGATASKNGNRLRAFALLLVLILLGRCKKDDYTDPREDALKRLLKTLRKEPKYED